MFCVVVCCVCVSCCFCCLLIDCCRRDTSNSISNRKQQYQLNVITVPYAASRGCCTAAAAAAAASGSLIRQAKDMRYLSYLSKVCIRTAEYPPGTREGELIGNLEALFAIEVAKSQMAIGIGFVIENPGLTLEAWLL